MTALALRAAPDTQCSVFEGVRTMREYGVRRLPVVALDGTLHGMVTADDVQRVVSTEMASLADALKKGVAREGSSGAFLMS